MNGNALGLIETLGLVGLIYAVDAMLKAASVELASPVIKLDGGIVSVMVQGDVSSVRAAVEAGARGRRQGRRAQGCPRHSPAGQRRRQRVWWRVGRVKVLVANLGSTSFKYRLFDMSDPAEPVLAQGAIERIGSPTAKVLIKSPRGDRELVCPIADHGEAVQLCLDQLTDPEIGVVQRPHRSRGNRVQGGSRSRISLEFTWLTRPCWPRWKPLPKSRRRTILPTPRPCGCSGTGFPELPLVAAFETGFHRTIPEARQRYAIPDAVGDQNSVSAAGGFTARAIAISRAGCPSYWAGRTSR